MKKALVRILIFILIVTIIQILFLLMDSSQNKNIDNKIYYNRRVVDKRFDLENHGSAIILLDSSEKFISTSQDVFYKLKIGDIINKKSNTNIMEVKRFDSIFSVEIPYFKK